MTRALRARGSRVIAVDPGEPMLGHLVAKAAAEAGPEARPAPGADGGRKPEAQAGVSGGARVPLAAVLGDGNALPLTDGVADLVTYAQSWHWLDPAVSIAEARRVLRPGGAIVGCWNFNHAAQADWLAAYETRLAEEVPTYYGPAVEEWSVPPIASAFEVVGGALDPVDAAGRHRALPARPALPLVHGGAVAGAGRRGGGPAAGGAAGGVPRGRAVGADAGLSGGGPVRRCRPGGVPR
ncbi:class I SAM-dependent methyltransferase [Nonomuraea salmonea]|uniref:class I SAM-dependent methyltransferase n=1 Tax=Nonomuraea salmonea TaxID=46181 RepID=UPI002FE9A65F